MIRNLREWIRKAEEIGELKRVRGEVDWDQELAAVYHLVARVPPAPSLEHIN